MEKGQREMGNVRNGKYDGSKDNIKAKIMVVVKMLKIEFKNRK